MTVPSTNSQLILSVLLETLMLFEVVQGSTGGPSRKMTIPTNNVRDTEIPLGTYRTIGRCEAAPNLGDLEVEVTIGLQGHQQARVTARAADGTMFARMDSALPLAQYKSAFLYEEFSFGNLGVVPILGCFHFVAGESAKKFVNSLYDELEFKYLASGSGGIFFCRGRRELVLGMGLHANLKDVRIDGAHCGFKMVETAATKARRLLAARPTAYSRTAAGSSRKRSLSVGAVKESKRRKDSLSGALPIGEFATATNWQVPDSLRVRIVRGDKSGGLRCTVKAVGSGSLPEVELEEVDYCLQAIEQHQNPAPEISVTTMFEKRSITWNSLRICPEGDDNWALQFLAKPPMLSVTLSLRRLAPA